MKKIFISVALVILAMSAAGAHPRRSQDFPNQPGDHFVPGHYVAPRSTEPKYVDGYTRRDGKYMDGYERKGGYLEGHFKEGHYVHPRQHKNSW